MIMRDMTWYDITKVDYIIQYAMVSYDIMQFKRRHVTIIGHILIHDEIV